MVYSKRAVLMGTFILLLLAHAFVATAQSTTNQLPPSITTLPVIDASQNITPELFDGYLITNFSPIILREGPSAGYFPVALTQGGILLEATGRARENAWWRVRTADGIVEGWIAAELLILRGDLRAVPDLTDAAFGRLIPATFVTFLPQTVYSAPEDRYETYICEVAVGEYLLLGRDAEAAWYQVDATCADGTPVIGWINRDAGVFRNPTGRGIAATDGSADGALTSQPLDGPAFVVFSEQPLYGLPVADAANVLCNVPGATFVVVGRNENSTYYQIAATCTDGASRIGWISVTVGAFQNNSSLRVPVSTIPEPPSPIPAREPFFITSVTQSVTNIPDGAVICQLPPREWLVLSRTRETSHYELEVTCPDGTVTNAWLPASVGVFRNPDSKPIPVTFERAESFAPVTGN